MLDAHHGDRRDDDDTTVSERLDQLECRLLRPPLPMPLPFRVGNESSRRCKGTPKPVWNRSGPRGRGTPRCLRRSVPRRSPALGNFKFTPSSWTTLKMLCLLVPLLLRAKRRWYPCSSRVLLSKQSDMGPRKMERRGLSCWSFETASLDKPRANIDLGKHHELSMRPARYMAAGVHRKVADFLPHKGGGRGSGRRSPKRARPVGPFQGAPALTSRTVYVSL